MALTSRFNRRTLGLWLAGAAGILLLLLAHGLPPSRLQVFLGVWPTLLFSSLFFLLCLHIAPLPLLVTGRWMERLLAWQRRIPTVVFLTVLSLFTLLLCGWLSGALFHHVPHVNDSLNQYIHAKFVASGHVSLPSHPLKEFFDSGWMINDGRWYSPYSPAHVVMLAAGHLAGLPWLVNPIVGALTVVAVYFLAEELYGRVTARLAAWLTVCCPLIIFMSSEFMNHATALLFTTLFMLYFLRTLRTKHWRDALLAGLSLGMIALTRPFTALALCAPYALLALWHLYKKFRAHFTPFVFMALGLFACALFQMWWNWQTTGDPLVFAYYHMWGTEGLPGLGKNPWGAAGSPHTVAEGISILGLRFVTMNEMLFEWRLPSLTFILLLFIGGGVRRQDGILLATYLSLVCIHALFQGKSDVFGPRYHYESVGALVILTAAAIVRLPEMLRAVFGNRHAENLIYGMCGVILFVLFAASNIPFRYALYSRDYPEASYGYYQSIVQNVRPPALVFAPGDRSFLSLAFTFPPQNDAPVIFAIDRGKENARLIAYYPCRNAYVRKEDGIVLVHMPPASCR